MDYSFKNDHTYSKYSNAMCKRENYRPMKTIHFDIGYLY